MSADDPVTLATASVITHARDMRPKGFTEATLAAEFPHRSLGAAVRQLVENGILRKDKAGRYHLVTPP